ncbi:MAG: hypothetical protein KC731_18565 [Myxococcales bacterium]|nr:hypothetical protein [Myxococcales bacterium]
MSANRGGRRSGRHGGPRRLGEGLPQQAVVIEAQAINDVIELIETTLELRTRHLGLDPAWFGASSRELGRIDVR